MNTAKEEFMEYCNTIDQLLEVESSLLSNVYVVGIGTGSQRLIDVGDIALKRCRAITFQMFEIEMLLGGEPEFVYQGK